MVALAVAGLFALFAPIVALVIRNPGGLLERSQLNGRYAVEPTPSALITSTLGVIPARRPANEQRVAA
jgi:hypothetical protein